MAKMIKITNSLRRRLERVHDKYQLSYEHISEVIGIESRTLYRIRMGTSQLIRVSNYQRLCRYFDEVESGEHPDSTPNQKSSAIDKPRSLEYLKSRLTNKMYRMLSEESGVSISVIYNIMKNKIDSVSDSVWDALALCVNDGESKKLKQGCKKIKAEKKPKLSKTEFAPAFADALAKRGLNYKTAAELIGISAPSVRSYALGNILPQERALRKIKEALPELARFLSPERR